MDIQGIERQLGSIMEMLDRQEQLLEEIRHHQRMMPKVEENADNENGITARGSTTTKTSA